MREYNGCVSDLGYSHRDKCINAVYGEIYEFFINVQYFKLSVCSAYLYREVDIINSAGQIAHHLCMRDCQPTQQPVEYAYP